MKTDSCGPLIVGLVFYNNSDLTFYNTEENPQLSGNKQDERSQLPREFIGMGVDYISYNSDSAVMAGRIAAFCADIE